MTPIAEIALDLSYPDEMVWVLVYAPQQESAADEWSCSFKIGPPLSVQRTIYGVSSLQAMVLALKTMSAYGSDAYQNKEL